jgi:hypothetical protein
MICAAYAEIRKTTIAAISSGVGIHEFVGTAEFEADAVFPARIVDERVNSAESTNRLFDYFRATFGRLQIHDHSVAPYPLQFPKELVACLQISIDDHGDRTFADRRSADCCAECPSHHQL